MLAYAADLATTLPTNHESGGLATSAYRDLL